VNIVSSSRTPPRASPFTEEPPTNSSPLGAASPMRALTFILCIAAVEFFVVTCISYLTNLFYGEIVWSHMKGRHALMWAIQIAACIIFVSTICKRYFAFHAQPRHRVVSNAVIDVALTFSFFLSALFLSRVTVDYSRATFIFQLIAVSASVVVIRVVAHARMRAAIDSDRVESRRAIVIGHSEKYGLVAKQLSDAGVNVVCSLPLPLEDSGGADGIGREKVRETMEKCRSQKPDDIVIMTMSADLPRSARLAEFLSELPVSVHMIPMDTGPLLGAARLGELGALVTIEMFSSPLSVANRILKRIFDVVAASIGLLLLWPVFLVVAVAIKFDSAGPIFFRQARQGYNNEIIRVYKLRTMTTTEDGYAFTQAKKNDPRVTKVGRFLRRRNIDELPQLLNVLAGDMSIVGPRPHPVSMNISFEQQISPLSRRHNVKPGITGWAQVNGYRGETDTLEKMQRRFDCDIHYIDNWSFLLDLKIIFMTVFTKAAYRNAF
jgi:Undecaprenyl-phosphate glucose phosphotransferase